MNDNPLPRDWTGFLEEIRSIAQLGLHYNGDPFDRERYHRLLELAAAEYSRLSGLPRGTIMERFCHELGHITPKVGVDAAIVSDVSRLLLLRRADDHLWSLPCGWAEVNETAQQAIEREVMEETGLRVRARHLIDVFSRLPGDYDQPHTSYHVLYYCEISEGILALSDEAVDAGYFDYRTVTEWHRDHRKKAQAAVRFHTDLCGGK